MTDSSDDPFEASPPAELDPDLLREIELGFDAIALDRPHDSLFRYVFSRPEHAASFLADALPEAIRRDIDWSTLSLENGTFVDEAFVRRETDLLFTAELRASRERVAIYLLFEHQSSFDAETLLRVVGYQIRIWTQWSALEANRGKPLPPVLTVVVAHDRTSWRGPTRFTDLSRLDDETRATLGDRLLDFRIDLVDVTSMDPDALLRERRWTDLVRFVVALYRFARSSGDLVEAIRPFASLLRGLAATRSGRRDVGALLRYILAVGDFDRKPMASMLRLHVGEETARTVMSFEERTRAEGEARGEARGIAKEALASRRKILVDLLTLKFGALPDDAARMIASAEIGDLVVWLRRIVFADSIDDVFAPRS